LGLFFGNETSGLSNDEIQHCHYLGYIDANKSYSSLNLSQAVQVIAYALRQEINLKEFNTITKEREIASFAEQNGFYAHLEDTLKNLELYDKVQGKRLMHRIRLMFNRIQMDKDEVQYF
jgi:TrmH family RNA methyltransferase